MSEDRRKVLEMVASGRVSVDDGERLLDALGRDEAPQRRREGRERVRADVRLGRRRIRLGAFPGLDVSAELGTRGERYLAGFRQAFGDDLDVDAVIDMVDHGVRPEYAVGMRDAFGDRLDAEDLVALSDHGVSVAYAKVVCNAFDEDVDPADMIRLRDHGVGAKFITKMRDAFGDDFDVEDLVKLSEHGVTSKYACAVRAAMGEVVVDDIIRLHDHGVGIDDLDGTEDGDDVEAEVVEPDVEPDEPDE